MPDFDRRLREAAQLRKLWRAFREPQERLEDARLSGPIVRGGPRLSPTQNPVAVYGRSAVRAAVRHWWCAGEYAAIVELGGRLNPVFLNEEPLTRVYVEEAKARLAKAAADPSWG